jgi:hypothetical protein
MKKSSLTSVVLCAWLSLVFPCCQVKAASSGTRRQQDQRPGLPAKRCQAVCQLLPELPLGCVHALQPPADIGLTEKQIKDNLLFTTEKVGETMKAPLTPSRPRTGLVPTRLT